MFVEFGSDIDRYTALDAQLKLIDVLLDGSKSSRGLRRLMRDKKNGVVLRPKDERFTTGEGGVTSPLQTDKSGRRFCEIEFSLSGHIRALEGKGIDPAVGQTGPSLVGHELGHAYGKLYGLDMSIEWERELMPAGHWLRPDHYTPYPRGGP